MHNQSSLNTSKYSHSQLQPSFQQADPSLQQYFSQVSSLIFPLQIRQQKAGTSLSQIGTMQILKIRVMSGKQSNIQQVKIQLTSEDDLFFNYITIIDKNQFTKLKKQQNLTIGFQSFIQMIIKLVNKVHTEKNNFFAVLCIRKDKTAHLDFNESVGYKTIEVLSLEFERVNHELNKMIVTYRFNLVKRRLMMLNGSLREVHGVLKVKNPSLYQKLNKRNSHAD